MATLDKLTLPALLAHAARAFEGQIALSRVSEGAVRPAYEYGALSREARRYARLLISLKVKPGDRVMLLCENRPEWVSAYFGIALAGAVAVPVLVDFLPEQIANVAEHAELRVACVSEKTLSKLSKLGDGIDRVLVDGMNDAGIEIIKGGVRLHQAIADGETALPGEALSPDDLACVLYTSGTSGSSKGVMLSHGNIVANVIATSQVFPLRPDDRVLSVMPLAHTLESTMGLLTPLYQGCAIYYLDRPPTAPVLAAALLKVKPTVMVIVPLIIEKLYRAKVEPKLRAHPLYRFAPTRALAIRAAGKKLEEAFGGAIRFLGVGGAALAKDVERFLLSARFPYAIGYGLTETAPLVAAAIPGKTRVGSTGKPLAGVSVRIMPPADAEHAGTMAALSDDSEGEIQVRGPNVMKGYYRDTERSQEVFTKDGWFRTGDLGAYDKDGMLYVKGRLKAMILGPSGENIYPEEIESTLASSGLVEEALVYASGDGALVAMVVLNERAKALLEEAKAAVRDASRAAADETERLLAGLRSATNARLASFSRIAHIVLQEQPFEKTATMKIKRYLYPGLRTEIS